MSQSAMVTVLALLATAAADPLVFSAPLVASPYTSAAYISPSAAYISPSASVVAAPVAPAVNAVPAAVPAAYPATVPYATVSAYSYGSSYSVQDYFPTVVNQSPSLAYSLPYAYAADYFYRR
ncbi:hypothetical protein ABMA27_004424 [Loxostege sticticalis]|uniref:Cuticle protein 16.5 n=1 Tax=Loxostege sticticalis TaxID=481309 RepID=A0ABR3HNK0_LOXSC